MASVKPLQRLSYSEKISKDNKWGKDNIDYYISSANFLQYTRNNILVGPGLARNVQILYDLYNNKIPEEWFHYVTNPLNSTKEQYTQFPAKLKPYTIIRPNVDLLLGEFNKRPSNYTVTVEGEQAYNSFIEAQTKLVEKNITQHFINQVNSSGVDTGEESQQVEIPEKLKKQFADTYKDELATMGQDGLNKLEEEVHITETLRKLFKDWLIAGEVFSYKGINNNDVIYEKVNPLHCDYDKSPEITFVEDGSWFAHRKLMTSADVVDYFYDRLSEEELNEIDKKNSLNYSPMAMFSGLNGNRDTLRDKVEVIHVTWKSQMKVGQLTYPDPLTGELQESEVDENYIVNKELGEKVKWVWVNQVWEGYRINREIYAGIKPILVQRTEMNNLSACKLPFNGRRFSDTNTVGISTVELGIPYQIMYIIVKYRLEMTIAKSKGKIVLIDSNVIPNQEGWDEEKFFYYADALGFGLINRNQIGVDKTYNQYQVLDMSLFDHIKQQIELLDSIKLEWDEVLGINRQRKGQTTSSDGKAVNEAAIFTSSVMSDILFTEFDEFVKREKQGLLDCSQFAWVNGKRGMYMNDDQRSVLLDLNPEKYCNAQFGVVATNSSKELERLNAMKNSVQAFAQNGATPSTIAEVLQADNFSKLKTILKDVERQEQERAQNEAKSEQEAQLRTEEIKKEFEQISHDFRIDEINAEWDRKDANTLIKGDIDLAASTKMGMDSNNNGIPDINEIEKRAVEREKIFTESSHKQRELNLKEEELRLKNEESKRKAQAETKKSENDLTIAKINANAKKKTGGS